MLRDLEDSVMTTQEACHYLRISRPTYLKYLYIGKDQGCQGRKRLEGSQIRVGSFPERGLQLSVFSTSSSL